MQYFPRARLHNSFMQRCFEVILGLEYTQGLTGPKDSKCQP